VSGPGAAAAPSQQPAIRRARTNIILARSAVVCGRRTTAVPVGARSPHRPDLSPRGHPRLPAIVAAEVSAIEATLYQVRNQSPKDKIAYPIQLNDRLTHLMAQVDEGHGAPIAAQQQVYETLRGELDKALARYRAALRGRMPA
jgi:hypothetical protein